MVHPILAVAALLIATTANANTKTPPALRPLLHVALLPPNPLRSADSGASTPVCVLDVCQPRVSVPGFEPKFSMSGRRTELALTYLDRIHLEPFATGAWWLVATGLRFDYTPGTNGNALQNAQGGRGRFQVLLRWRLDPANHPIFPVRHHG
jgi:hypothetical protein